MAANSVGVITLLLALKARYPRNVSLLRRNHESRDLTKIYGFKEECSWRGMHNLWSRMCDVFDLLPLAAVIHGKEKQAFGVHGGITSQLHKLEDIDTLDRRREIPTTGFMNDLTWNDPREHIEKFDYNYNRGGCEEYYGRAAVKQFCENNKIDFILRAHELAPSGYNKLFDEKVITVWSATNYGGRVNSASVLKLDEKLNKEFSVFSSDGTTFRSSF